MSLIMDVLTRANRENQNSKETSAAFPGIRRESRSGLPHPFESVTPSRYSSFLLVIWRFFLRPLTKGLGVLAVGLLSLFLISILVFKFWQGNPIKDVTTDTIVEAIPSDSKISSSADTSGQNIVTSVAVPPVAANKLKQESRQAPPALEGLILDGKEPYCLIAGQILKVGDEWEGNKITKIGPQGVSLVNPDGKVMNLAMKK